MKLRINASMPKDFQAKLARKARIKKHSSKEDDEMIKRLCELNPEVGKPLIAVNGTEIPNSVVLAVDTKGYSSFAAAYPSSMSSKIIIQSYGIFDRVEKISLSKEEFNLLKTLNV